MGCGVTSGSVLTEAPMRAPTLETPPTVQLPIIPDPRVQDIETELQLLKVNAHALTLENEKLKQEINREMSALFPQLFNTSATADELIDEWLLLDLFEGDKQLNFFGLMHPEGQTITDAVKRYSSGMRARETSLREYITYFKIRYEEGNRALGLMGEEKFKIDDCVKDMKGKLVAEVRQFETHLGKKSKELDKLTELYKSVQGKSSGADFISGLQAFYETALAFLIEHFEAKIKSASDAYEKLRYDHSRYLTELQKQHASQIQARNDDIERSQRHWHALLKKQADDLYTQKATFRLDLDNQILHFEEHCKHLRRNFEEEHKGLRADLAKEKENVKERDEETARLEEVVRNCEDRVRKLEEIKAENEAKIEELSICVAQQNERIEFYETEMAVKADLEIECSKLHTEVEHLLSVQSDLQSQLQFAHADISAKENRIESLLAQMAEEAEQQRRRWKQTTSIRVMTRYAARMRLERAAVLLVWHAVTGDNEVLKPVVSIPVPKSPYPHNVVDALTDETFDPSHEEFANEVINMRAEATLRSCELTEEYAVIAQKEKPMIPPQIFKIFEEMMARKFESDLSDIKNDKLPRGIPSFLLEHLYRSVGLRPLAIKTLNQFVPGLQQLHEEGHPYGLVICRLLQMFHEDPVHYLMGLYLTDAFSQYNLVTQKFEKIKSERGSSRGVKKNQPITPRMRKQLKPYLGGNAFLQDVMTLVYNLFDCDRGIGERVIKLIHPEELSLEEFVIFLICQKMAKLGRTPESLFRLLDPLNAGSIFEGEFVSRIRESLDLWLPEVSLRVLFRSMAKKEKRLTLSVFTSAINFAAYSGNCTNEDYAVPACSFLMALIQVFKENERKFAMRVKKLLESRSLAAVSGSDFDRLLGVIDPNMHSPEVAELWSLALRDTGVTDSLTVDQFVTVLLNRPVGKLRESAFCELYIDRKEVTAMLLRANSASPSLSTIESTRSLSPASPRGLRSPISFEF